MAHHRVMSTAIAAPRPLDPDRLSLHMDRLLRFARSKVQGWTEWVLRQSLMVRALIGLVGLAFVAGAIAIYAEVVGLPAWLPLID